MDAFEARALSERRFHEIVREIKEREERQTQLSLEKMKEEKKQWFEQFDKMIRQQIHAQAYSGDRTVKSTLYSSSLPCNVEEFLKQFKFADELNKVMQYLQEDGYAVKLIESCEWFDDSLAYLNSDGACGSMEVYYKEQIIFVVDW